MSVGDRNIDANGTESDGFWDGSLATQVNNSIAGERILRGTFEPHGTLVLPKNLGDLSWAGGTKLRHGVTIGVAGQAVREIPVPAGLPLIVGALAKLGFLRCRT